MQAPDRVLIGTTGWRHAGWRGPFYPPSLPEAAWLEHYAGQFPCVEIPDTFHELPGAEELRAWAAQTPAHFRFAVQAPRTVTHVKKLKHCDAALEAFVTRVEVLGERLGPIVFRLPTRWRCNLKRLEAFLGALPRGPRYAFELTEPSWLAEPVYALLRAHGATLAGVSPGTVPEVGVAVGCLRLASPAPAQSGSYRARRLRTWVSRALAWSRDAGPVVMVFDSTERAYAVRNARRAAALLEASTAEHITPAGAATP